MLLISRQGKVRLAKWYTTMATRSKSETTARNEAEPLLLTRQHQTDKIIKDVTQLVLARRTRMCNFLEYKGPCGSHAARNLTPSRIDRRSRSSFRFKGRLPPLRELVLCLRHRPARQRTHHARDHSPVSRSRPLRLVSRRLIKSFCPVDTSRYSTVTLATCASWICESHNGGQTPRAPRLTLNVVRQHLQLSKGVLGKLSDLGRFDRIGLA